MLVTDTSFTIERSIEIHVGRQQLWDLLEDEDRVFDLRPGLVEHEVISTHEAGGHDCVQVYDRNGRRSVHNCRTIRHDPPGCLVGADSSDIGLATITMLLTEHNESTVLAIRNETTLQRGVNPLRRWAMRAGHDRGLRLSLRHIKFVAEHP